MASNTNLDLHSRAMAAYFRSATGSGGTAMQPNSPNTVTVKGLDYIVLSNLNGVLAVYRVRTVNGQSMLKGLKRWPHEIDQMFRR